MGQMFGWDGTGWDGTFTPKWYGLDDDGLGNPSDWNTFSGVIKVWHNNQWTIFWPPGADGGATTSPNPTLVDKFISAFNGGGGSCRADYELQTDGDIFSYKNQNGITQGSATAQGEWLDDVAALPNSLWEYNIFKIGGNTSPSGSIVHANTVDFDPLSSNTAWYLSRTGNGTNDAILDLQIREIADITNIVTAEITLNCFVSSA